MEQAKTTGRVLKEERLKLYGSGAYALMDSAAIANVMSKTMEERLCVKPEEYTHLSTVATEDDSPVVGM